MFHPPRLSRRRLVINGLALATTVSLQRAASALGLSSETQVCRLTPEQETGPYYIADELLRSDIAEGKPGVPLSLRLVLLHARTCRPLSNVAVDLWHCDALGLYSGFTKQNPMGPGGPPPGFDPQHPGNRPGPPEGRMGPPPPPHNHPTDHLTFLRGIQMSDGNGAVHFRSIFPGCYQGRTNHIHFKVRIGGQADEKSYHAGHTSHTGQVFFPEELAIQLMQREPYNKHEIHRTTQAEDMIYNGQRGELSVVRITPLHSKDYAAGFQADLIAAVDPDATPSEARRERSGLPPPPES